MGRKKEVTQKSLDELTFEELVELITHHVHSALLESGGTGMKSAIWLWMQQVILWSKNKTELNPTKQN